MFDALGPFKYTLPIVGTTIVSLAWYGAAAAQIAAGVPPLDAAFNTAANGLGETFGPVWDLGEYALDGIVG